MLAKSDDTERLFGPDLIRATAIVLVLLSHTFPGGHTFQTIRILKDCLGYLGVEVFFILSGYLIGGILIRDLLGNRLNSMAGVLAFWKRRWFRTLPNYYLFLFLFLLFARIDTGHFPAEGKWFFGFGQALFSKPPDFFAAAWSLAIEEWFYLLFPLLLLVWIRLMPDRKRALFASIGILLIVPVILRCFLPLDTGWDAGVRKVTLPRLDVLMYGVCLAYLQSHQSRIWTRLVNGWPLGMVAIASLIGYWWFYRARFGDFNQDSLLHRVFFFCITSVGLSLVFPKVVGLTAPRHRLALVVRKLSLWSYSIYLSHTFFGGLIVAVFTHFGWSIYKLNALVISGLIWMTSLTTSALLYRFYEKPLMNLRDQPLKSMLHRFSRSFRGHNRGPT